ncbi:hypothetical protein Hypma_014060, partial [Hypsizygus marmoreus]
YHSESFPSHDPEAEISEDLSDMRCLSTLVSHVKKQTRFQELPGLPLRGLQINWRKIAATATSFLGRSWYKPVSKVQAWEQGPSMPNRFEATETRKSILLLLVSV